jgi:hypothetical protein
MFKGFRMTELQRLSNHRGHYQYLRRQEFSTKLETNTLLKEIMMEEVCSVLELSGCWSNNE